MKTNYYILLVLLLSFSFASAQSNGVENTTVEPIVIISETVQETSVDVIEVENNEAPVIKDDLARTNSDIKIYLNRLRNEGNINLLFPKINKVQTA